jgi:hypothetical protein
MIYAKALKASEGSVADDLTTATLQTTFAGLPLKLSWSGGGGTATAFSLSVDPQGSGVGVGDPASGDAGAGGLVFGVSCFADGSIEGAYLVAPNGTPTLDGATPPSHTPAAFARAGGRGPRCVKG